MQTLMKLLAAAATVNTLATPAEAQARSGEAALDGKQVEFSIGDDGVCTFNYKPEEGHLHAVTVTPFLPGADLVSIFEKAQFTFTVVANNEVMRKMGSPQLDDKSAARIAQDAIEKCARERRGPGA